MITENAQRKINKFNSEGLHYNLVADAAYEKRKLISNPFGIEYQSYIIAALISFDMGRMMGQGGSKKYDIKADGFAKLLRNKLKTIEKYLIKLADYSLTDLDIEKEKLNIKKAYHELSNDGPEGLNQKGYKFHVGATKILHFINPNLFIIVDSNAARSFKKHHKVKFKNSTQPGYSGDLYVECLSLAKKDITNFGKKKFKELEKGTPLARIYDKLTFITGSELVLTKVSS